MCGKIGKSANWLQCRVRCAMYGAHIGVTADMAKCFTCIVFGSIVFCLLASSRGTHHTSLHDTKPAGTLSIMTLCLSLISAHQGPSLKPILGAWHLPEAALLRWPYLFSRKWNILPSLQCPCVCLVFFYASPPLSSLHRIPYSSANPPLLFFKSQRKCALPMKCFHLAEGGQEPGCLPSELHRHLFCLFLLEFHDAVTVSLSTSLSTCERVESRGQFVSALYPSSVSFYIH